ncbi:MAG: trigger factor [Alphaproteobacteria bacterium]|jgi:trigger factor|nr:trigger factor [Alphaproteobacteria bacterium]
MDVTETSAEGLRREFKVVVPADEIDSAYNAKLNEIGRQVRLPGFRPGKVPMRILKQRYGQSVIGEVLEDTVNQTSRQTMSDRGLRPAMEPKIAIQAFEPGKDLEYTIELELLPEIEIPDFAEVSVERPVVEVTDETVDETLATLAERYPQYEPPAEPRPAQKGDRVAIDCAASVDGEPVEALSEHGMEIVLGQDSFVPEVEEALIGRSPEDHVSVSATAPENLQVPNVAGKPVQFEIDLNEVREPRPHEINDEFATHFGEENLDGLRTRIREEQERQFKQMGRSRAKRVLLDRLAEQARFDLPESLVQSEFETIWHEVEHAKEHGHLSAAEAAKPEEDLRREYYQIAARRVRLGLLLSEVAQRNNIEVSREELSSAIMREAMRYGGGQYQELLDHIKQNPAAIQRFRAPLLEEKAVDYILELANVEERPMSADALRQLLEEEEEAGDVPTSGTTSEATSSPQPEDEAGPGGESADSSSAAERTG